MWKIVSEIQYMYKIEHKIAADIVLNEFLVFDLKNEENATIENVALLRIACWNEANILMKKNK